MGKKILIIALTIFMLAAKNVSAEDYVVYKNFNTDNKIYFIDMEENIKVSEKQEIINSYKKMTNSGEVVIGIIDCSYIEKENKAEEIYKETSEKPGIALIYDTSEGKLWGYSKNVSLKLNGEIQTEDAVKTIKEIAQNEEDKNTDDGKSGLLIVPLVAIAFILAIAINIVLREKRRRSKKA